MDQAWQIEQDSWAAAAAGEGAEFLSKIMRDDAFVVVPGRVLDHDDVIARLDGNRPWRRYRLDDERLTLLDGESVLVTYRVSAEGDASPAYRGRVTSMYSWDDGGWALAFRQHTPDGDAAAVDGTAG